MQVKATAKSLRISPRKLRLVVDQVRGLPVEKAAALLSVMDKKGAKYVATLLKSAVANAEHNNQLQKSSLKIEAITANEGFTIKRFRPRAFGRAAMIRKRTSHLYIVLEGTPELPKTKKKTATKKPVAKKAVEKTETVVEQPKETKEETKKENK